MSWLRAAEPEMKKRIRPPNRSRIFVPISRSAMAYWTPSSPVGFLPCSRSSLTSRPTPVAQVKSLAFGPPSSAIIVWMRPCAFSKMRGAAPMKVGLTTARFSTILSIRPSMAVGKPICRGSVRSTLPNTCASGSQRYCRSSSERMLIEATAAPSYVHELCRSRTPLGRPVVPEV